MLHSMIILIQVDQLEYLCYGVKCQSWGHLGSQGSKGHFHLKCSNSSMLHSMTIRLIHVHQLETRYICHGVKCQPGVIWGHSGQILIT